LLHPQVLVNIVEVETEMNAEPLMDTTEISQVKVIIVDDQEVFREAFGMILYTDPSVDLVGVFGDGESAIQMIPALSPDVFMMDVKMLGLNGIAAARGIRENYPEVGIILLSAYAYSDRDFMRDFREFLKDDPRGKSYLLKDALETMDELIRTIHDVAAGRTVLDPIMVERTPSQNGLLENSALKDLTRRELEVLSLMAMPCTNSAIARILDIQPRALEHHIDSIFSKLDIQPEHGQPARLQAVLIYLHETKSALYSAIEHDAPRGYCMGCLYNAAHEEEGVFNRRLIASVGSLIVQAFRTIRPRENRRNR